MGVDLSKKSNVLFFAVFIPTVSYFLSMGFNSLISEVWNPGDTLNTLYLPQSISLFVAYGILYKLFERYLWSRGIFRLLGIVRVPDLRGRWKGTLSSTYKENGANIKIPAYLEIKQTFSKIVVYAYYERSQSESVVANFVERNEEFYLFYTYDNEPSSKRAESMREHKGTVKLRYIPQEKILLGRYFNSIGNDGEIRLEFERMELMRRFE